ncbi:hypothetical protein D7X30_02480 [Corallococcus sp. AB011P]|uniref:hemopexin repeat-containing protein n=1 Tax=Corallococcus sp. AB011P TaxID=2316735 RepID=UPI000EA036C5|nr:hemopexin repeat-containing protein [Corallococcus sp. AB011P]RKG62207.1 hypothetical protein D7X30_02480 [Corallococcus sp. AB011P]
MFKHVLSTKDPAAAMQEWESLGGRELHRFSESVFVAELPEGVEVAALKYSQPLQPEALDGASSLAVDAWRAMEDKARRKEMGPAEGLPWDAPGYQPPRKKDAEKEKALKVIPRRALTGPVGIGLVIVSGPGEGLDFSSEQRSKVVQEALEGLNFLVGAEPRARVSFSYDIRPVSVSAPPGSVMRITDGWNGLPADFTGGFNAAVCGRGPFAGKGYFFKGDSYIRYDWQSDRVDSGPRLIADCWHGLPEGFTSDFDAVINGDGPFAGKCYFFKGDSYVRYDWQSDRVDSGPRRITDGWYGLPEGFTSDFDAAVCGQGPFAGKGYFFKGDSYIRYDWQSDRVDSGPRLITDGWYDLPPGCTASLEAVLEGDGPFAGKCYFFKGSAYARYDWARDRADPYCSDRDYEPCEATWRDAALQQMGFDPGTTGVEQYVRQLTSRMNVPQALVVFFTRYPLTHFGYALRGGPSIVLHYDNDGWGPDNINRTLAHEACHIFWALDEYASSGCTCDGTPYSAFKVPNRNCENCPDEHVDCIMNKNTLALCAFTRGQLGWNYGLDRVGTAVCGEGPFNGKAYFFEGSSYVRYDWASDQADPGQPRPITDGWHGLPESFTGDFDAILTGGGPFAGKCYFFKGDAYVRYDWASDRVDSGPRRITDGWHGLPEGFTEGLDAAVCGQGPFAGKGYFFKGDAYVRYDWRSDRVDSGPRIITDGWHGLPPGFTEGFDAILNGGGQFAGKCYFFKGDSYVRYDWQSDRVDPGYPRKICDEWPGVLMWPANS